jgi:hypothetical protein
MHHYGEAAVKVEISENNFMILLQNHITGAEITVSGPIEGIFETKDRKLDQMSAENLGRELAHFLRETLK